MKQIIIALALLVSMPAQANFYETGNDLVKHCEDFDCSEYLTGFVDAQFITGLYQSNFKGDFKISFCVAVGVTGQQLQKIFLKYANEHPANLHLTAGQMVMDALIAAFPCE